MHPRLHLSLWFTIALVACDSQEKSTPPAQAVDAQTITKSERPASSPPPEPQVPSPPAASEPDTAENRALAATAWDALELDPDLAPQAFQQMIPGSEEKNQLLEHFAMRLADRDPDAAIQWATDLTHPGEKSLALGKIALVLSDRHPERAARLLSESVTPGPAHDQAIVQVLQRWAAIAPAAAAGWVVLLDAGDARSTGLVEVLGSWIGQDPTAAFAWIPTIPLPALRTEGERGAATYIFNEPASDQPSLLKSATPGTRTQFAQLTAAASSPNRK